MNTRLKSLIICMLIIVFGLGSSSAWARPTEPPPPVYLPNIYNIYAPPLEIKWSTIASVKGVGYSVGGRIENLSDKPVYDVILSAELFNNDVSKGVVTGTTALPATFPGGENYFQFDIEEFCDGECPYKLNIVSWTYEEGDTKYLPLTAIPYGCGDEGEIRNDNSVPVESVRVIVVPGNIIYNVADVEKTYLLPGESTSYSTFIYPWCFGGVDTFAQGEAVK